MKPRAATVERVADGEYVVTGVAVDALPMVKPTVDIRIHRVITRGKALRWRLEIGGETYVYAGTLLRARLDASQRAFALDEVPSKPGVTPHRPDLWSHVVRAYVTGVFRGRFPKATLVEVDFDEREERWRAWIDGECWIMAISSDDEEFRFWSSDQQLINFPIPERL